MVYKGGGIIETYNDLEVNEFLQDCIAMYICLKTQSKTKDIHLQEVYGFIELYFYSIMLFEFIKIYASIKEKNKEPIYKFLNKWRTRFLKTIPKQGSETLDKFVNEMGIDFDHYAFDTYVIRNEINKQVVGISFGVWDLIKATEEDKTNFSVLANVLIATIEKICNQKNIKIIDDDIVNKVTEVIGEKINIKKYAYASGVMFKGNGLTEYDKLIVMYYYYFFSIFNIIEKLIPTIKINISGDDNEVFIDTKRTLLKVRATLIDSFWECIESSNSIIIETIKNKLKTQITNKKGYSLNRKLRNNIHYGTTSYINDEEYSIIDLFQQEYYGAVLDVFNQYISIKLGLGYKIIKWIADHTDEKVLEQKKKEKVKRKQRGS